jgi:hypothetical protein
MKTAPQDRSVTETVKGSYSSELAAQLIEVGVALMRLVPDQRIEKAGSVYSMARAMASSDRS